jgi:hypothetical protein
MEIFGGFMVMMSILGLFLAVVWLIMPFVVFAIKGKQDRSLELLEIIEKRLATMEDNITSLRSEYSSQASPAEPLSDVDLPAANHDTQPPVLPLA